MKQLLLFFLLLPFFSFTQNQIGSKIIGEANGDNSGNSVSLSSNGNILAIGAYLNDGENGEESGHVRVYENQSGVWTQIGNDINGEASGDASGRSVSLSSDGSIVAIGAPFNNGNGGSSGHVRIYENQSGVWTQIGDDLDGETSPDYSGWSVSLSSNGSIIAIGAPFNNGNGNLAGHVRVYENISGVWTQIGLDIDGDEGVDQSGYSVSLSSDGSIVAIGAIYGDDGNNNNTGDVKVYKNQSGNWTQIGNDIDGDLTGDQFGYSVSLSSDGSVVAIGASNGNSLRHGYVKSIRYKCSFIN